MSTNPKITIITAAYNSGKTISQTIQSVLEQSYNNIEYIIIDAQSSDDTIQIIKQYESKFNNNLIWKSEPDKGIYDAWNKGISISTGDWIMFVGSDDILCSSTIRTYVDAIKNNQQANFISSMCQLVDEDLFLIRVYGTKWNDNMNKYCVIAHVGSLHHKSLFLAKGLFNDYYKITGDYDFLLRCRDIIKPLFIPVVTAIVRDGGISSRNIFKISKERFDVKISNNSRSKLLCYYDYFDTILKFYVRNLIVKLSINKHEQYIKRYNK
jgi:glycosyltransferase involved in cell wall biosynthesis